MEYSKEQRERISKEAEGKVIESLEFDETGDYWVMTFTDDSEISFRFMWRNWRSDGQLLRRTDL